MKINSSIYRIKKLPREMNSEMLKILRESPIKSNGTIIGFEREPNIFTLADLKYDNPVYTGFFRKDELLGFVLMGLYLAFVNGKPETVCHMTNFHVKDKGRFRGFYYKASGKIFNDFVTDLRVGYAVVMKGNKNAESHISRRHNNFPAIPYTQIINTLDVKNIIVLFKRRENEKYKIRQAVNADIDAIIELMKEDFSKRLFAPYIDKNIFMENLKQRPDFGIENYYIAIDKNKIVGVCAAWDCSAFKQLRIFRYGRKMKIIKKLFALISVIFGTLRMPDEGKIFKDIYITDYAIKDRNPAIMKALLSRIYNDCKKKKYNMIIFGSCSNDTLLRAAKGFLRISIRSSIIMGSNDIQLLKGESIDKSLPYIDVALL